MKYRQLFSRKICLNELKVRCRYISTRDRIISTCAETRRTIKRMSHLIFFPSIRSTLSVRRDATMSSGAAASRRAAPRRDARAIGSSPAALAGCRCLAWRALREVPKYPRASYTRATIDRAPFSQVRLSGHSPFFFFRFILPPPLPVLPITPTVFASPFSEHLEKKKKKNFFCREI